MELQSQNIQIDRQPYVADKFYSGNKDTLLRDMAKMFAGCKKIHAKWAVRAIITPHAGYVFSGNTAAAGFSVTPRDAGYKNIFIIGSSHIMAFDGASVYSSGDYITPLGRMTINREIAAKLKNENRVFDYPEDAHIQDHCIEVQVPFIQYYYTKAQKIVPIIIGTNDPSVIRRIAEALKQYFTPDNLFVISSDFSHYPAYKDAIDNDKRTADAIISGDPEVFLSTLESNASRNIPGLVTSMCGWTSGLTILYLSQGNRNLEFRKIDYSNSGESPYGDKDQVVGYNAIALVEKEGVSGTGQKNREEINYSAKGKNISAEETKPERLNDSNSESTTLSENTTAKAEEKGGPRVNETIPQEMSFTENEKEMLFSIARNSIKSKLFDNKKYSIDESRIPEALKQQYGAFVTLKENGVLRGCIGRFVSSDPLYSVVQESALSSAFEDPRFSPLTKQEYDKIEVEITVLGPMKKINNINEIVLGKHGIYIKKDFRSGTMLPQVPIEYGWTLEEFLGYTSRDKAGIGWDGWKTADIYIYEGKVLEENKK
ncbi:MAG: AmmeMemoRadiSam system protein B [Bacteroidales bacterium]|jgi:hypothetical protein